MSYFVPIYMSWSDKTSYEDMLHWIKLLPLYSNFDSLPDLKEIIEDQKVLYFYFFRLHMFNIVDFLIELFTIIHLN